MAADQFENCPWSEKKCADYVLDKSKGDRHRRYSMRTSQKAYGWPDEPCEIPNINRIHQAQEGDQNIRLVFSARESVPMRKPSETIDSRPRGAQSVASR